MNIGPAMDRRDLLQRALLLVGAAALPGGGEALAAVVKSGKRQLDPARYALLVAVADTIVPKTDTPGAVEAAVPERLDALLGTWASPAQRDMLIAALDEIDMLARKTGQKGFAALAPGERNALLAPHDVAALKQVPQSPEPNMSRTGAVNSLADPKTGKLKQEPLNRFAGPPVVNPGYAKLKELIVVLFYYSEAALTHDLTYEHAPGHWQPSVPITPETRPAGGLGLF